MQINTEQINQMNEQMIKESPVNIQGIINNINSY